MEDRRALIKANGPISYNFKEAIFVGEDNFGLNASLHSATKSGIYPKLNDLNAKLERLSLGEKRATITYQQVSPA